MKKIQIEFNPFEKEVYIKYDEIKWSKNDNKYFSGYDFESALTGIIKIILNEICMDGDNELEIEFFGRKIEYVMLKDALNKVSELKVNIKHQMKYDISVSALIKKIKKLDKEFFKRKNELLKKLESNPEIFVIGNYSTGKSTFLNAILRNDILYTDTDVATNKLLYIINDDKEQLCVSDGKNWKQESFKNIDELKEKIHQLNHNSRVSKIKLYYPLEAFKEIKLQFIDTPGVNNAIDEEHRRLAFDAINDEINYPLVLIFVDAQNYKSTDYESFFNTIKEKLNSDKNLERFIFIINKADVADDIKKLSENVKEYLFNLFENNKLKIFFTDSLLAQALYKKERGEKLSRKERRQVRDLEDDMEYEEAIFFPEYSTVYELFNIDRNNLVEYSGVPFVEKYIKNYLINSFEKEKIEDVLNELNRVEEEYRLKITEKLKEIENKQIEIENLKNKLFNKDFNSIFRDLENQIKKEEKELKNLEVKIKKFQESLDSVKKRIYNISIDKKKINDIQEQWTEEINKKISKIDIIERLNSLSIEKFTKKNVKKIMKNLFKTTSEFKCSEYSKKRLFSKLNEAANEQLQIFEDRFNLFKRDFENIKNSSEDMFWKQVYNLFKIDKNKTKKEEIIKFINSAIDALEDELKTIQKLKQKPIVKEGFFSRKQYCQVDVLIDKIEYMIEKDKGIYKYYYLLRRLPELSIELSSEFEAQFKKNILKEVENIQKEISNLIESSDFNKLEKMDLQTINLKGFDKFKNIFLYRDSLEENKNILFNINLKPGKEWIDHTAKYLNEKELIKINTEFRKEAELLKNKVDQEIANIKNTIQNNVNDLEKELFSLQQKQQHKIEKLKNIKKEYDKTKNEQQKEQRIKKEIININKEIENLQKTIKKYESFLRQLTFKDEL